jgi:TolB-like protein
VGRSTAPAAAPSPPPATPDASDLAFIPAIAVLPISTRLGDADEDAGFAADLTEELLASLSSYSIFRILPGSMSALWHGKLADPRPVARDLGALYLLNGALRRAGDGFRVTIKLLEGDSGKILWTQKFDRPLAELAALPDPLAQLMATQADDRASWLQIEQTRAKTSGLTAWDHMFRAIFGQIDTSAARLRMATEENRQAVALAPQWGMAHATMAFTLAITRLHLGDADGRMVDEAKHHLNLAAYLDKTSPMVFMYAGGASNLLGDPVSGLRMVARAQALHPRQSSIHFHLTVSYLLLGRLHDAVREGDVHFSTAATEQLHRWVCMYQSAAHFLAGNHEAAIAATNRAQHFNPNGDYGLIWRAALFALLGDESQARATMVKLQQLEPDLTPDTGVGMLKWMLMADTVKAEAAQTAFRKVWKDMAGAATPSPAGL